MINLLEQARNNSISDLSDLIEQLKEERFDNSFKEIALTASQIMNESEVKAIAKELPQAGKHIYFFTTNGELLIPENYKQEQYAVRKFAKRNGVGGNKYLYVGSCSSTKLSNRFIQHCGWGHAGTYALQLRCWLPEKTELTFSYAHVETSQDVLQQMEDGLRNIVHQLFGKSGANNKGKS